MAERGSGSAYGLRHFVPEPENCRASSVASRSIDWSTSHAT